MKNNLYLELTDRTKQIFKTVVESYLETGSPSGSETVLKRAGLDYWDNISWKYFKNINVYYKQLIKKKNFHLLTTKSPFSYTSKRFKPGDSIVFGSETKGIDNSFLKKNWENTCTIPMLNQNIRSLNLATSVGIVLYEALRQNGKT